MDAQYKDDLEAGLEYQDWAVTQLLHQCGLAVVSLWSRQSQFHVGENLTGIEIKYDRQLKRTDNLYIETHQRSRPELDYTPGGIYYPDNAWLYAIGDYTVLYVMAKSTLRILDKWANGRPKFHHLEINGKTSKGFLLPRKDGERWAANVVRAEVAA